MRGSNNGGDPMFIDYRWKLHGIVGQGDSQSDHETVGICPTCGARTFTTPRDSAHSTLRAGDAATFPQDDGSFQRSVILRA